MNYINELFDNNINLAYKFAQKYKNNYKIELDDAKQLALIGLFNATKIYDKEKGSFVNLACRCMSNEINMSFRKQKIYTTDIEIMSFDEIAIKDNSMENEIIERLEYKENYKLIKEKINKLKDKDKKMLKYLIQGYTQKQIGDKLNVTQSYISKSIKRIKNKITCKI